ncbi:MAG: DAK2 domain-containing protein [Clostridiales Family XIII bacterium]|nr:DAK2 domain-containing protein [Clostridiales Family XIII bacterium]
MEKISVEDLPALFSCIGSTMKENEGLLCSMDAEMGDGDLGLTMSKGFLAMPEIVQSISQSETDLSTVLFQSGMKLASVVPSTMGTLLASGMMSAGKMLRGQDIIDGRGLFVFLQGLADGVAKRGRCTPGDRTVLDAFAGAIAEAGKYEGGSLSEVAEAAYNGARKGVEDTKQMLPKFGKAAIFTDRAIGREDQGAVAGMLLIKAIWDFTLN